VVTFPPRLGERDAALGAPCCVNDCRDPDKHLASAKWPTLVCDDPFADERLRYGLDLKAGFGEIAPRKGDPHG